MPRPARTNLASTRQTVAMLRRESRLGDEHEALVLLAESTAAALDQVIKNNKEKRYVVAQIARAHLMAVEALLAAATVTPLDPFAAFVAELSTTET